MTENLRFIYLDTETTGLNPKKDKIIELAMVVVEDDVIIKEYDEFINHHEKISEEVTELTGISNEILEKEGISEVQVMWDIFDLWKPGTVIIAHNTQFDLSFVYELLKRYTRFAYNIIQKCYYIDTLTIVKDRKAYPHKLCDCCEYYNIEVDNFHRAIDDTKALYNLVEKLDEERDDLKQYANIFGFNPRYGVTGKKFNFIKYIPQAFHDCICCSEEILPHQEG